MRTTLSFILLPGVLLLVFTGPVSTYHLGGDEMMCWVGDLDVPDSTVLLSTCPANYRHFWVDEPPAVMTAGESYTVRWLMEVDFVDEVVEFGGYTMPHSNLHSCVSTVPFCTPSATGDLVTTTPAIKTDLAPDGRMLFEANLTLSVLNSTRTTWTTIAHTYLVTTGNIRRDIAIGIITQVQPNVVENELASWALILFYVLAGVALGVTCLFLAATLLFYQNKVIRYSSPPFLIVMALGAAVALVSIYFLGTTTDATCVLREWFFGVGYVMLFGALFAKTFRIYKLFANTEYKVVAVYNWQLAVAVLLLELVLVAILAVWSSPPFRPEPTVDLADNEIEFVLRCDGNHYNVFVGFLSGYYLLLALVGLMLAFLTRNINAVFNESVWIGYSCFCLIVVAVITPIQFLIDSDPTPVFALRSAGILVSIFFTVLFMFCPKFYRMARGNVADLDTMRSVTSGSSLAAGTQLNSYEVNSQAWLRNGRIRKKVRSDLRGLVEEGSRLLKKHDTGEQINGGEISKLSASFQGVAKLVFSRGSTLHE